MTRAVSDDFRESTEAEQTDEVFVLMATITHEELAVPIRINSDVVDYLYGGETFYGVAFSASFVSDDENPPKAQISIQNVDQRIGDVLLGLSTSPKIKFELLARSDFDDRDPRQPIVISPTPEYIATNLFLRNIQCDAMTISAEMQSFDISSEPWPKLRTTPEFTPALSR